MGKADRPDPNQQGLFDRADPAMRRTIDLQPRRKIGSPGPIAKETAGRDEALEKLEKARTGLVSIARDIAIELARHRGRITSVEVFAEMRAQGYDEALDSVDPRWMGAVFRENIWVRLDWELTGSHRRPVAVWGLKKGYELL